MSHSILTTSRQADRSSGLNHAAQKSFASIGFDWLKQLVILRGIGSLLRMEIRDRFTHRCSVSTAGFPIIGLYIKVLLILGQQLNLQEPGQTGGRNGCRRIALLPH